jgi:hypothetical protein
MDKSIINVNSIKFLDAIRFVLLLKPTYPETPPRLYCITRFCEPELCDARDLLEDTLQMKWDPQKCFLKLIISQLPSLIRRYLIMTSNYGNENELGTKRKMFGKYYLDSIYELTIIKYIPYLYFDVISEVISSDEKSMNLEDRKILITDNFLLLFCNKSLYELDQLQLIFVGPITSLTYIRQFIKDGLVLLKWFVKGKGVGNYNTFTMQLRTPDGNYIVDTLIDNLSKQKIKFKVTNKKDGNIVREGTAPRVEISLVEEEIKHLEDKINNREDISKESISVLINLYEKAIQYYSAMNNKKFEEYIKRIQSIYSNNEYTSLLNMKTISSANNQYNVTQFKRKRKKRSGNNDEEGTGKKKKEKKSKKKSDKKIEKNEIKKENENKEEDEKEKSKNKDELSKVEETEKENLKEDDRKSQKEKYEINDDNILIDIKTIEDGKDNEKMKEEKQNDKEKEKEKYENKEDEEKRSEINKEKESSRTSELFKETNNENYGRKNEKGENKVSHNDSLPPTSYDKKKKFNEDEIVNNFSKDENINKQKFKESMDEYNDFENNFSKSNEFEKNSNLKKEKDESKNNEETNQNNIDNDNDDY